jgi:hypothetical protein
MCCDCHGPRGLPSFHPLAARCFFVKLLEIGKFSSRFENDCLHWLLVLPLLDHTGNVDGHQFKIWQQFFSVTRHPGGFVEFWSRML